MQNHNDPDSAVANAKTSEAVVADFVARHLKPRVLTLNSESEELGANVLVLPQSLRAEGIEKFLEPYRERPKRREGTAKLVDLESFIDHVNRFKDADSALFAMPSPTAPTLLAVFDYHEANASDGSAVGKPRFGKHRALYTFPLADEWTAWGAQNGKTMAQAEFASFLEDRILDVAPPDGAFTAAKAFAEQLGLASFASPAKLLELSRGLTVHVEDRTTNKVNPNTGETTLHFELEHRDEGGGALVVPRAFIIQVPVFREGVAYQLPVRLRYRAGGGRVTWSYEIHDLGKAFDNAFREACTMARDGAELPLFYGAPEAP